ncbi:MAG: hypothetical protein D6729_02595 [Deltaproteobacteria bacterium]|nr:MAG: hypothetical protein D6729_02595 [Deltaproteobacteria bacterium]
MGGGALGCAGRTAAWEAEDAAREAGAAKAAAAGDAEAEKTHEALVAEGDAAWAERTDPDKIRLAIEKWTKAVEVQPDDWQTMVKLTRAHYFLADGYLRDDEAAYLATMDEGVRWGERAMMAVSPGFKKKMKAGGRIPDAVQEVGKEGVGALYWYASNLGKWAKKKGFTVVLGQKDNIKAIMERALELDPTYFYGGPDRYFGAYYAIAPAFAGGDLEKSLAHYEKSLQIAPNYAGTYVLMAENLAYKKQDRKMFEENLKKVLEMPDDIIPELVAETRVEKQKAKELLDQIDELF